MTAWNLYPTRQADLDLAYAASLASIADGAAKTEGMSVGESVAAVILALRGSDGSAVTLPYTLPPGPGIYQPAPAALFVAWDNVAPFVLQSGSQFRGEGPPALSSAEYASDYDEVQSLGALTSVTRTPDQTESALFWMENIQIPFNRIAEFEQNELLRGLRGPDTMKPEYANCAARSRRAARAATGSSNSN